MAHLVISAAIAGLIVLAVWLLDTQIAAALRGLLGQLGPVHLLELVTMLVLATVFGSFAARDPRFRDSLAAPRATWAGAATMVGRIPTMVALTTIVALAAGFRIVLGVKATVPRVLGDELVYSGVAKSLALHGKPLLRGELDVGHSLLYPLFAAPAYRLASDGAAAFAALKAMNSVAMALTAVPVYFLARRVLSRGWSLGAAALSVAAPWTAYASLAMTESLFYPLFAGFALAFVLMLEQPTWRRQLGVLAALGVLVLARPQALALLASLLAAIVLRGVLDGSLRRSLATFSPTFFLLGGAVAVAAIVGAAGVPLPASGYNALFHAHYGVLDVVKWTWWNAAVYELAVGVVALVAFPVALAGLLRRAASASEQAFGVAGVALFGGLLLSVALLSASPYGLGIVHERSLFYATPLILVCLFHWLLNPRPPRVALAAASALVAVALPATLSESLVQRTNDIDGPALSPFRELKDAAPDIPVQDWMIAVAVLGVAVFLVARRPLASVVSVVLAFAAMIAANDYEGRLSPSDDRTLAWVDNTIPSNATATIVHVGFTPDPLASCGTAAKEEQQDFVVWTEFFNTRVDRVAHVYGPIQRDGLASPSLNVAPGGVLYESLRPLEPDYVVIDSRAPIVGTRIRRLDLASLHSAPDQGGSLTLWKVDPPLRFAPRQGVLPPRADGRGC